MLINIRGLGRQGAWKINQEGVARLTAWNLRGLFSVNQKKTYSTERQCQYGEVIQRGQDFE